MSLRISQNIKGKVEVCLGKILRSVSICNFAPCRAHFVDREKKEKNDLLILTQNLGKGYCIEILNDMLANLNF